MRRRSIWPAEQAVTTNTLPRKSQRLGTRLASVVALTLLFVVGGAGAVAISLTAQAYREETLQRAAAMLTMLAGPAALAVADSTFDKLDGYLCEAVRPNGQDIQLLSVVTLDSAGRAVAGSTDALGPPPIPGESHQISQQFSEQAVRSPHPMWRRLVSARGAVYLIVSAPAVSGLRWGTLVGVFDAQLVEIRITRTLRYVLLIVFLTAGLLAAVTYAAFSRMAVQPMQELAHAAESIRRGQHGKRLNWHRRDELGMMAASFDHMAEEVERFTDSLQRKVAERSAQIEEKNRELHFANTQLRVVNTELERLAHVDPLTTVANRRSFDAELLQLTQRAVNPPWALLMCDIDYFKRVNDTFGHPVGDVVLREVARLLRDELRGADRIARYGGEEFVILLADTGPETAMEVARRLVTVVSRGEFDRIAGLALGAITVSIGVAVYPEDGGVQDQLLDRTDVALYAAKAAGRNRVVRWSPELTTAPLS
ncbi:MAG: sensor domain-containing diguanylate cyclase [Myxococcales bacterium]|nr:sensor domain-containing diguanylate cyclase [Myxococcales bacterium]